MSNSPLVNSSECLAHQRARLRNPSTQLLLYEVIDFLLPSVIVSLLG